MEGIKLFSLWKNVSQKGNTWYSGKCGINKIIAFPITDKKSERAPDLEIWIQAEKKEEDKKFAPQELDYRTGNPVEPDCPF